MFGEHWGGEAGDGGEEGGQGVKGKELYVGLGKRLLLLLNCGEIGKALASKGFIR